MVVYLPSKRIFKNFITQAYKKKHKKIITIKKNNINLQLSN